MQVSTILREFIGFNAQTRWISAADDIYVCTATMTQHLQTLHLYSGKETDVKHNNNLKKLRKSCNATTSEKR